METPPTLIVGYGITGKNLHREIAVLNPDIYRRQSKGIPIASNNQFQQSV